MLPESAVRNTFSLLEHRVPPALPLAARTKNA
jgi:hypothetical protein